MPVCDLQAALAGEPEDSFPVSGSRRDAALLYRDGSLVYYLEIGTTGSDGTNVYRATAPVSCPGAGSGAAQAQQAAA